MNISSKSFMRSFFLYKKVRSNPIKFHNLSIDHLDLDHKGKTKINIIKVIIVPNKALSSVMPGRKSWKKDIINQPNK